jgi:hypothetical protein
MCCEATEPPTAVCRGAMYTVRKPDNSWSYKPPNNEKIGTANCNPESAPSNKNRLKPAAVSCMVFWAVAPFAPAWVRSKNMENKILTLPLGFNSALIDLF